MSDFTEELNFLPVVSGNRLVCTDTKRSQRHGQDNDDDYFDEVDSEGNIVAKYHTWHHMSTFPPQNIISQGWKKFDLEGNEIDSGSRN